MKFFHDRSMQKGFFLFLPILTLGAVTLFHFSSDYLESSSSFGYFPVLTTLTCLLSIFSMGLVFHIFSLYEKLEYFREIQERGGKAYFQNLQKKIDFLSALREMSLAANEQTDFQTILQTVLHLLEGVLLPEEISIYLKEEEEAPLKAVVYGKKGDVFFSPEIPHSSQTQHLAEESMNHRKNSKEISGEDVILTHLLSAEKESFGVIAVKIPAHRDIAEAQSNLTVLSKHIALAIRKPTLYDRAVLDSLTTLYTKRHFLQQIKKLFSMSKRLDKSFSLVLVDIDHFKSVNDTYGHLTGDIVLREMGGILKNSIREYDSAYRYGGEELALLLPETELKDAFSIAERIRKKVEGLSICGEKGELLNITFSAGVVSYEPHHSNFEDLISQADKCLYQAKKQGRNRVIFAESKAA